MEDKLRLQKLAEVFYAVYHGKYGLQLIRQNDAWLQAVIPADIIRLTDMLVKNNIPMVGLKKGINKFLNVVHKTLRDQEHPDPSPGSLLDFCIRNNAELDSRLKALRPLIRIWNDQPDDLSVCKELAERFGELEVYNRYYQIKENVIFPMLEKKWKDYRCLRIMWSFHDDIRKNLRQIHELLSGDTPEVTAFNPLAGDIFFQMYAIRFREEKILFPVMMETIPEEELNALIRESHTIGFPFVQPDLPEEEKVEELLFSGGLVDMKSGFLTPEQIILIFNHLPVDITYVDENDQVKFFSTPPDRIFIRTNAALGRDVRNCHPAESISVVEEILDAFRKGERDSATFWVDIREEKVLIQYFACRDAEGNYKGVVEVSQVISAIQSLTGEKRLLDWKRI
jgi:hypothetical protein